MYKYYRSLSTNNRPPSLPPLIPSNLLGELALEIVVEEIQSDLRLVSGHFMSGTAHCSKGEASAGPLGKIARSLAGNRVRQPSGARILESERDRQTERERESV